MFSPYKDKANILDLEYYINKYFLIDIFLIHILYTLGPVYLESGYMQCNVNTIVDYYIIVSWNHSYSKVYHDRLSRHETVLPHHVASMRWIQKETSS